MGLGLVTYVPTQALPLHYQCCMTAQIPKIYEGRKGGGGRRTRSKREGHVQGSAHTGRQW